MPLRLVGLLLVAAPIPVRSFALPGIGQARQFLPGEHVDVKATSLRSPINLPIPHYQLPFCLPPEISTAVENLGEILAGDRIETSIYAINFLVEQRHKLACVRSLDRDELAAFRLRVQQLYRLHFLLDSLPVTQYGGSRLGFPLGCLARNSTRGLRNHPANEDAVFLHNHFRIRVYWNTDQAEPGAGHIVGFNVEPFSAGIEGSQGSDVSVATSDCHTLPGYTPVSLRPPTSHAGKGGKGSGSAGSGSSLLGDDERVNVAFSYDVLWVQSPVTWANRHAASQEAAQAEHERLQHSRLRWPALLACLAADVAILCALLASVRRDLRLSLPMLAGDSDGSDVSSHQLELGVAGIQTDAPHPRPHLAPSANASGADQQKQQQQEAHWLSAVRSLCGSGAGGSQRAGAVAGRAASWKSLHAVVFRPPSHPVLFCAVVGAGAQVCCCVLAVLCCGVLGLFSDASTGGRGSFVTALFTSFMCFGTAAGYHAARTAQRFAAVTASAAGPAAATPLLPPPEWRMPCGTDVLCPGFATDGRCGRLERFFAHLLSVPLRDRQPELLAAALLPAVFLPVFVVMNAVLHAASSTTMATPLGVLLALLMLVLVTEVLALVGGAFARSGRPPPPPPCSTRLTDSERERERERERHSDSGHGSQPASSATASAPRRSSRAHLLLTVLGPAVPTLSCIIECYFLLQAVLHQSDAGAGPTFGLVLAGFVLLLLTAAETAVILAYLQLCHEDHRWWWRSLFNAGGCALLFFLFAVVVYGCSFAAEQHPTALVTMLFVGYLFVACTALFLAVGCTAFYATSTFVRRIFATVHE